MNKLEKKVENQSEIFSGKKGITLIALVVTIVLNRSYLAMEQMNRFEKI